MDDYYVWSSISHPQHLAATERVATRYDLACHTKVNIPRSERKLEVLITACLVD